LFPEAVIFAVRLGGNTDRIGAMTRAIAGALHGLSAIPANWVDALENSATGWDYALDLARPLHKVYAESQA
jgi:poly(ADP-ribose) glycohydrolase ARH3